MNTQSIEGSLYIDVRDSKPTNDTKDKPYKVIKIRPLFTYILGLITAPNAGTIPESCQKYLPTDYEDLINTIRSTIPTKPVGTDDYLVFTYSFSTRKVVGRIHYKKDQPQSASNTTTLTYKQRLAVTKADDAAYTPFVLSHDIMDFLSYIFQVYYTKASNAEDNSCPFFTEIVAHHSNFYKSSRTSLSVDVSSILPFFWEAFHIPEWYTMSPGNWFSNGLTVMCVSIGITYDHISLTLLNKIPVEFKSYCANILKSFYESVGVTSGLSGDRLFKELHKHRFQLANSALREVSVQNDNVVATIFGGQTISSVSIINASASEVFNLSAEAPVPTLNKTRKPVPNDGSVKKTSSSTGGSNLSDLGSD